jgi:hypothetical protein
MNVSMQRPLNRVEPTLPAHLMRTHYILAPLNTHWRRGTCEEAECRPYLEGWGTPAKAFNEEDLSRLRHMGYKWGVVQIAEGEDHFWFEAGQRCFRSWAEPHMVQLERPGIFLVRDGDHRGNPRKTEPVVFSGPDSWADSLNTNLEKLQD